MPIKESATDNKSAPGERVSLVSHATLEHIRKTPFAVGRLRGMIKGHVPYFEQLAVTNLLDHMGYELTPEQEEILSTSLPWVEKDKQALLTAQAHHLVNPEGFRRNIAGQLGVDTSDISDFNSHPTSLTIQLDQNAFENTWVNGLSDEERDMGIAQPLDMPRGFFANEFLAIQGVHKLPYALRGHNSDEGTADHEAIHVQYRYLHPEQLPGGKIRQSGIGKKRPLDEEIRAQAKAIAREYMLSFLDELTASSLRRSSVYYLFSKDGYHARFNQLQYNQLRYQFPSDIDGRLLCEAIIWEEALTTQHKMRFVQDEYNRMVRDDTPTQTITNITASLTPERGYLAVFMNPDIDSDPSSFRPVIKDYNFGGKAERNADKIKDYSDFFTSLALRDNEDYHISPFWEEISKTADRLKELVTKKGASTVYEYITTSLGEATQQAMDLAKTSIEARLAILSEIKTSRFFQEQHLSAIEQREIWQRTTKNVLGINKMLSDQLESYYKKVSGSSTHENQDRPGLYVRPDNSAKSPELAKDVLVKLTALSLKFDDAVEEAQRRFLAGEDVDIFEMFKGKTLRNDEYSMDVLTYLTDPSKPLSELPSITRTSILFLRSLRSNKRIAEYEKKRVDQGEVWQKATSIVIRTLLWARRMGIKGEQIDTVKAYLWQLAATDKMPDFYRDFLEVAGLFEAPDFNLYLDAERI